LHRQNVGSLGSIGISTYDESAIPSPNEAPDVTATLSTLLVEFD